MTRRRLAHSHVLAASLLLVPLLAAACGSDDDDGNGDSHGGAHEGPCGEIEEKCAPKDDGTDQVIADCHDLGHDGTEEECEAAEAMCLAACGA